MLNAQQVLILKVQQLYHVNFIVGKNIYLTKIDF